jgi:glyoxylase-like metal-dependent hydrolase (beta-lactamase superfamily II)
MGTPIVNWYLVEEEGRLTAVDAGLPRFAEGLEAQLGAIGQRIEDVEAVVLIHSDSDHTGFVPRLREAGARVLIHADDDATLRRPRPKTGDGSPRHVVPYLWRPGFWRFAGHMMRGGGAKLPRIEGAETFVDGELLDVPGGPRVVHTPGHTAGHSALLFERHGALMLGDSLCTWNPLTGRRFPQVMPSAFNVSTETCFESLAAIEALEAEVLLPGHGDPWRDSPAAAVAQARAARR